VTEDKKMLKLFMNEISDEELYSDRTKIIRGFQESDKLN
jgi:hypothetical protein